MFASITTIFSSNNTVINPQVAASAVLTLEGLQIIENRTWGFKKFKDSLYSIHAEDAYSWLIANNTINTHKTPIPIEQMILKSRLDCG